MGCPLSWNKRSGGTTTSCEGFELSLIGHSVGLSEWRASWCVKSASPTAGSRYVKSSGSRSVRRERVGLSPLYALSGSGSKAGRKENCAVLRGVLPPVLEQFSGKGEVRARWNRVSTNRPRTREWELEVGFQSEERLAGYGKLPLAPGRHQVRSVSLRACEERDRLSSRGDVGNLVRPLDVRSVHSANWRRGSQEAFRVMPSVTNNRAERSTFEQVDNE